MKIEFQMIQRFVLEKSAIYQSFVIPAILTVGIDLLCHPSQSYLIDKPVNDLRNISVKGMNMVIFIRKSVNDSRLNSVDIWKNKNIKFL